MQRAHRMLWKGFGNILLKADIVKGRPTVGENIFTIHFLSRRQKR